MIELVRLNGQMFTRKSVSVRLNGLARIKGIDSIEWNDAVPKELVGGMNSGGPPLGQAHGNYTCAGSISLYMDTAIAFARAIGVIQAAFDPTSIGALASAPFTINVAFKEDIRVGTVILSGCTIAGRDNSVGNDGSALVKKITLQPTIVIEDGFSLVSLIPAL